MTDTKQKTIYDLEVHEDLDITDRMRVKRVPGGWMYLFFAQYDDEPRGATFVPYNEEFKEPEKEYPF